MACSDDKKDCFYNISDYPPHTSTDVKKMLQLYSLLHALLREKRMLPRILGVQKTCAIKIVSTRKKGVCYFLSVPLDVGYSLRKSLQVFDPTLKIDEIRDESKGENIYTYKKSVFLRLKSSFLYPLGTSNLSEDPVQFIYACMAKLTNQEEVSVTLTLTPVKSKKAEGYLKKITRGEDVLSSFGFFNKTSLPKRVTPYSSLFPRITDAYINIQKKRYLLSILPSRLPKRIIHEYIHIFQNFYNDEEMEMMSKKIKPTVLFITSSYIQKNNLLYYLRGEKMRGKKLFPLLVSRGIPFFKDLIV